jgi:hypothetical protein
MPAPQEIITRFFIIAMGTVYGGASGEVTEV